MLDRRFALTVPFVLLGCTAAPAQPGRLLDTPEVHAAITTSERRHERHSLTTFAQIAEFERDLALLQRQWDRPGLSGLYAALWDDKIELSTAGGCRSRKPIAGTPSLSTIASASSGRCGGSDPRDRQA